MKKGQAAMEFLMTYGWAILVVLVAIGALAYFGVLSPDKLIPERCMLQSGVECVDSKVDATSATIVVKNALGYNIDITNLSVGDSCSEAQSVTLVNGEQATLAATGCTFTVGEKLNADLAIDYTNAKSGLSHVLTGSLVKAVE